MGHTNRSVGIKDVALVVMGWFAFTLGLLIPMPAVGAVFMAVARVLPKALYDSVKGTLQE